MILWRDARRGEEGGRGVQARRVPLPRARRDRRDRPRARGGAQNDPDEAAAALQDGARRGAASELEGRPPASCGARGARSSAPWASSPDSPRPRPFLHSIHRVFNRAYLSSRCETDVSTEWNLRMAKLERLRRKRDPKKTPEPFGGASAAGARRSSSSSATTRGACTTTSGSSATARSPRGPCRRACRSSRASGRSRFTSRTTRSSTRASRARSRRASTAPARSRSGITAPTSCSRRSATAA